MTTLTLPKHQRTLHRGLFITIIIVGILLRFTALTQAPPGLTHDEADHALDALGVLNGIRPLYFTVGYGREPLYDYVTSIIMLIAGPSYIASRLTAAAFGLALMVLVYAFVRQASGNPWLALATMAAICVGFWAVMHSRAALRSITLPTIYAASALALWRAFRVTVEPDFRIELRRASWGWFVLSGILLGTSIYTYLAARVMWAVVPALFVYLLIIYRRQVVKLLIGLPIVLGTALAVAVPLILYLRNNPSAEVRISQLASPLDSLLAGDPGPLLTNVLAGLQIVFISGDDLWLYNIPGRPLLTPLLGVLFVVGFVIALENILRPHRRVRQGSVTQVQAFRMTSLNAWMLLTAAAGIVPALVVGIGGSSTRVIGMMPALYYFPALGVWKLSEWADSATEQHGARVVWGSYSLIIAVVLGITVHQYFHVWANARDVRVAYHTTLIETLRELEQRDDLGQDIALSTITPGPFHDSAVATVWLKRDDLDLRWFDGRSALVVPASDSGTWIFPEIADLNQKLTWWMVQEDSYRLDSLETRPDDFNRVVRFVTWDERLRIHSAQMGHSQRTAFDDTLTLINTNVLPFGTTSPGDTLTVITWWRIESVPSTDLVLFTHALDESGTLVAQQDQLGVPTTSWYTGDIFLQLHELTLPPDMSAGAITLVVGAYTTPDIQRLEAIIDGETMGQQVTIATVEVTQP